MDRSTGTFSMYRICCDCHRSHRSWISRTVRFWRCRRTGASKPCNDLFWVFPCRGLA